MCSPLAGGLTGWSISQANKSQREAPREAPRETVIHNNYSSPNTSEDKIAENTSTKNTTNRSSLNTGMY